VGAVSDKVSGHGASGYLSGKGLLTALGDGYLAGKHASISVRDGVPV
jgi:fumarate reductase flavoprotein subunit